MVHFTMIPDDKALPSYSIPSNSTSKMSVA